MGGDCEGEPMSIHIKGKLPTGRCEAQFFPSGLVAFYDVEGRYLGESKYKELPPHGRLIDADALFRTMNDVAWYSNADRDEVALEIVLDAKTIIPAEGGAE